MARLLAQRLDRERPLWEAYLVEGLAADRVALLTKSHQALVDGTDTVDLAQVLLEETDRSPRAWGAAACAHEATTKADSRDLNAPCPTPRSVSRSMPAGMPGLRCCRPG